MDGLSRNMGAICKQFYRMTKMVCIDKELDDTQSYNNSRFGGWKNPIFDRFRRWNSALRWKERAIGCKLKLARDCLTVRKEREEGGDERGKGYPEGREGYSKSTIRTMKTAETS